MPRRETITFSNGTRGVLEMPNLYALLASVGSTPAPQIAAVLRLLEGTGALELQNERQRLMGQIAFYQGLFELAALCLVEPKLVLKRQEGGDPFKPAEPRPLTPGEIGPEDLSFNDVQVIYYRFFLGEPAIVGLPKSNGVDGPPGAAPARDDVPLEAAE